MPSDLTVSRVAAAAAVADGRPTSAQLRAAAPEPAAPTRTALPNPSLRLDPGLAMVVIEFRDDSGKVRSSIPSPEQLDAYRAWERSKAGPPPRGSGEEAKAAVPPAPSATPSESAPPVSAPPPSAPAAERGGAVNEGESPTA